MKIQNLPRKLKKKVIKEEEEFVDNMIRLTIEGWDSWLKGIDYPKIPKEIYTTCFDENYLKRTIKAFEEKFKRKLKYRIKGLAYISYAETEVG